MTFINGNDPLVLWIQICADTSLQSISWLGLYRESILCQSSMEAGIINGMWVRYDRTFVLWLWLWLSMIQTIVWETASLPITVQTSWCVLRNKYIDVCVLWGNLCNTGHGKLSKKHSTPISFHPEMMYHWEGISVQKRFTMEFETYC